MRKKNPLSVSVRERIKLLWDGPGWSLRNLRLKADPWQADFLNDQSRRIILNCNRQAGKSTIAAAKAVYMAVNRPDSLILLISPSQRQSGELFRKVWRFVSMIQPKPVLTEENKTSLAFANGSRIVSLPSSEETIRGYSKVDLIIEDEASAVPDELYEACLPMLAVSNGQYVLLSTPRGRQGHFWKAWSSGNWKQYSITADKIPRISTEFLEAVKLDIGSRKYAQEFMCEFLEGDTNVIRRSWLRYWKVKPGDAGTIIQSWDTAFKEGEENDFSVCTTWFATRTGYYLMDLWRGQVGFPELKKKAVELYNKHLPEVVLIEDAASGQSLIQELMAETLIPLKPVKPDRDKITRTNAAAPLFEAGRVWFPELAAFLHDLEEELIGFPNAEHDDQVDSVVHALRWLRDNVMIGEDPWAKMPLCNDTGFDDLGFA